MMNQWEVIQDFVELAINGVIVFQMMMGIAVIVID